MKLFEILRTNIPHVTEDQLRARLKAFDWKYEFSNDDSVVRSGEKEMQLLENQLYQLWKQDPDKAQAIWEDSCPWAVKGTTPSFIVSFLSQE